MESCGLHCLKLHHLSVILGDSLILKDINLHVHCGELTAIIGKNGAGKSTLLKSILGEINHTGKVTFTGHDGAEVENIKIGYVPQSLSVDSGTPKIKKIGRAHV